MTTAFGQVSAEAWTVGVQADGKIVAAGYGNIDGGHNFALARYNSNGTLDASFGTGGKVNTPFLGSGQGFSYAEVNSLTFQPDGRILLAGHRGGASLTIDFALNRYQPDGAPDQSFGDLGAVTKDIGGGDDVGEDLAVQADGRIVVVGRGTTGALSDFAVARFDEDGDVDTGFGENGAVTADFHGGADFGQDVALQPDGKIVAAGHAANGFDTEFALIRIDP